jgi:hypothetical protein
MKQLSRMVIPLFATTFLLALVLVSVSAGTGHAAAMKLRPTPSGSKGVNAQATDLLSPNLTFCLPTQQVVGTNNGQVASGGFSFGNTSGTPIGTLWTVYNGPAKGSLSIIGQSPNHSFFHQIFTVPIGSFYQTCLTNTTNVVISFSIQQSESTLN